MRLLFTLASWSVLLPLSIIIFKRGKPNREQSILKWIIYVAVITEIILGFLWYQRLNNLPLFHIYPLIELALLTLIYQHVFGALYPVWIIRVLSGSIIVFSIINSLFIQSIFTFSSNAITLASALLIFYAISYFFFCLEAQQRITLKENPCSGSTVQC